MSNKLELNLFLFVRFTTASSVGQTRRGIELRDDQHSYRSGGSGSGASVVTPKSLKRTSVVLVAIARAAILDFPFFLSNEYFGLK